MKFFIKVVLGVAAALALSVFSAAAGEACCPAGLPCDQALQVDGTNSVVIGTIYTCDITNVAFRVINTSDKPVLITRLIPTCSCTTGTASTNLVLAGGAFIVTVRLDPNTLKGDFSRGVWVVSDDSDEPYLRLMLVGAVESLFSGAPVGPVVLSAKEAGLPVTNRITLVAAAADVRLGAPAIETGGAVQVAMTIVTNVGKTASYQLTAVATPLELGNQSVAIRLPVIGRPAAEPLDISFRVVTGLELTAIPVRIVFSLDSKPQTLRVILRGRTDEMDPERLTWEPKREGVKVSAIRGRRGSELLVAVEVSPEAAEALYLAENPVLQLGYPGHRPAVVAFENELDSDDDGRPSSIRRVSPAGNIPSRAGKRPMPSRRRTGF